MKRIQRHLLGVDQGDTMLFSDFENGGEMWTGQGQRERRKRIAFSEKFHETPAVQISISLWDLDNATPFRGDVKAENVTPDGFDMVFRTWSDTRVARTRINWTAIGALLGEDDWDIH